MQLKSRLKWRIKKPNHIQQALKRWKKYWNLNPKATQFQLLITNEKYEKLKRETQKNDWTKSSFKCNSITRDDLNCIKSDCQTWCSLNPKNLFINIYLIKPQPIVSKWKHFKHLTISMSKKQNKPENLSKCLQ